MERTAHRSGWGSTYSPPESTPGYAVPMGIGTSDPADSSWIKTPKLEKQMSAGEVGRMLFNSVHSNGFDSSRGSMDLRRAISNTRSVHSEAAVEVSAKDISREREEMGYQAAARRSAKRKGGGTRGRIPSEEDYMSKKPGYVSGGYFDPSLNEFMEQNLSAFSMGGKGASSSPFGPSSSSMAMKPANTGAARSNPTPDFANFSMPPAASSPAMMMGGDFDFDPFGLVNPAPAPAAPGFGFGGPAEKSSRKKLTLEERFNVVEEKLGFEVRQRLEDLSVSNLKEVKKAMRQLIKHNNPQPVLDLVVVSEEDDEGSDSDSDNSDSDAEEAKGGEHRAALPAWNWRSSAEPQPMGLFRSFGDDMCGDVFLRIRSKVVRKKWKPVFLQVTRAGEDRYSPACITAYNTTRDWQTGSAEYLNINIHPFMSCGLVEEKDYNGIPMYTFRLIQNTEKGIEENNYRGSTFHATLPTEIVMKFGYNHYDTIHVLQQEVDYLVEQCIKQARTR